MSLSKYKEKRFFDKSPEPTGGKPTGSKLRFVVQKHHASHLHYDFRLELRGILKSWAVPKGPSMDPSVNRLAMLVEDHPWDYRSFEGIIPSGYGAGTVIVWDEGTYETTVINEKDKKSQEHSITSQFWQGQIKFTLQGHKLKGSFQITRAKDKGKNAWYLLKLKDKYASKEDITMKDKSVISKKTLEQVKENPGREWKSHRQEKTTIRKQKVAVQKTISSTDQLIKKGEKSAYPSSVEPMLCTLIKEPFNDEDFLYEVKLDGYRVIANVKKKKATLSSRSGLNYSKYYKPVIDELSLFDFEVVLDGEVVVLNEEGKPDFDALQKNDGSKPLAFYAFDVLWYKGYNLMQLPLVERKEILSGILPQNDIIKYNESFDDGLQLFELIRQQQMEGIVAKRKVSEYQPGKRGKDWLKIPAEQKQEFVIGGWTESESGSAFRSLLFGAYEKGKFKFVGHAGHGFKEKEKPSIKARLKKLEKKKSPFINDVDAETEVHWVKPELVANIKFATYTSSGKIRKPAIFLGFRDDKKPEEVVEEKPLDIEVVETEQPAGKTEIYEDSNWKEIEKEKISSEETFNIEGHDVRLTNIEKEIWKGVTKADLITYYHSVASYMLPHLKDRPLSLHIKNKGATRPGLYIKDMEGKQPGFAGIFNTKRKHKKKGKRDEIDYLICQNEATLLYLINLGCIDINPWTARTTNPLQPDYIIIDLDPSDNDFKKAIETALAAKIFFNERKLKVFPKTSGKTGIHLYIPCHGFSFPDARTVAIKISKAIHDLVPEITTTEITISNRGDKLYIDPNQNDEADTVAAPYSVRPFHQPLVSTPIEWKELNDKLDPKNFRIENILERLQKKGDLFNGVLSEKYRKLNTPVLKKILHKV